MESCILVLSSLVPRSSFAPRNEAESQRDARKLQPNAHTCAGFKTVTSFLSFSTVAQIRKLTGYHRNAPQRLPWQHTVVTMATPVRTTTGRCDNNGRVILMRGEPRDHRSSLPNCPFCHENLFHSVWTHPCGEGKNLCSSSVANCMHVHSCVLKVQRLTSTHCGRLELDLNASYEALESSTLVLWTLAHTLLGS